jgi:hypothetical protein
MEDVIGLSLQPIMFLLLFTYVFGDAIAHGSTHTYLQYELPGLLVMTVVFATLGTGLMLNQDISRRSASSSCSPRWPSASTGAGPNRVRIYPDRAPSMSWYTQESNTSSASRTRDGPAAVSAAARFGNCPVAAALTIAATCVARCSSGLTPVLAC